MRAFVQVRAKRDAQVHRTGLTWVDHTSEAYSIAQTIALVRRLLDGMASCTLRGCVLCTAWLFCTVLFHALSRMSYGICCALSAARCTKLVARWRLGPWGACEKCHFAARLLHAAVCTRMFTVLFLTITHRRAHFHPDAVTPSSIRVHSRALSRIALLQVQRARLLFGVHGRPHAPTLSPPFALHPPIPRYPHPPAHPVPQSSRTVPPA